MFKLCLHLKVGFHKKEKYCGHFCGCFVVIIMVKRWKKTKRKNQREKLFINFVCLCKKEIDQIHDSQSNQTSQVVDRVHYKYIYIYILATVGAVQLLQVKKKKFVCWLIARFSLCGTPKIKYNTTLRPINLCLCVCVCVICSSCLFDFDI